MSAKNVVTTKSPLHDTGDYSRRIRRLSPKKRRHIVAEFGAVWSVDRA